MRRGAPVIVTRTFSKVYGLGGLRAGYAVAAPEVLEALLVIREAFGTNSVAQAAAAAALGDVEHVRRSVEMNRAREGPRRRRRSPGAGSAVLPSLTQLRHLRHARRRAARSSGACSARGVIVRPLDPYDMRELAARVRSARREENTAFLAALDAVLGRERRHEKQRTRRRDRRPLGRRQVDRRPRAGRAARLHLHRHRRHVPRARPEGEPRRRLARLRGGARRAVPRVVDPAVARAAGASSSTADDVTADVRSREISRASSLVSVHPGVRVEMVARQREMGRDGGVVLDGRDIGTAVFPDAEVKFFLDANPGERAGRRLERAARGGQRRLVRHRRARGPRARLHGHPPRPSRRSRRAWDAIALDTTKLPPEEVVERMLAAVRAREGRPLDLGRLAAAAPPLAPPLPRGAARRAAERRALPAAQGPGGRADARTARRRRTSCSRAAAASAWATRTFAVGAGHALHRAGAGRAPLPLDHGGHAAARLLRPARGLGGRDE